EVPLHAHLRQPQSDEAPVEPAPPAAPGAAHGDEFPERRGRRADDGGVRRVGGREGAVVDEGGVEVLDSACITGQVRLSLIPVGAPRRTTSPARGSQYPGRPAASWPHRTPGW